MARTKETKMSPEQQEKMTPEVVASLQSSTYGKDYAQEHSSFFEEVENSDLEVVTEDVAATTSNMEDELTNEVQSSPNPQKRISGKQRKASLEEYQQTFLQVPRIDDRKPVFVSSMYETVLIVSSASSEGDASKCIGASSRTSCATT